MANGRFLTFDPQATIQLLAQGKPSPLQGIGQALTGFAQAKQQQELNQQKLATMRVQEELAEQQLTGTKMQNRLTEFQTVGDEATGLLPLSDIQRVVAYGNLPEDSLLRKEFGENIPTVDQLKAVQLRGVGAKNVWLTEQKRQAEAAKTAKKPGLAPETDLGDLESAFTFVSGETIGRGKEPLEGELPEKDMSKISSLVATTANKMRKEADVAGTVMSEDEARQKAWDEIRKHGIIKYEGENYLGNNYSLDTEKYQSFLKGEEIESPAFEWTKEYTDADGRAVYQTADGKFLYADGTEYKAE